MQGLLTRPDWQEACKVPLAMIPTGSGNALCANTGGCACPKAVLRVRLASAAASGTSVMCSSMLNGICIVSGARDLPRGSIWLAAAV